MTESEVEAVGVFGGLLDDMLERARATKRTNTIEPPILKSDLSDLLSRFESVGGVSKSLESKKLTQYAVIETAARAIFYDALASSNIEAPGFVQIWNLFDIIAILSDDEQCDPVLLMWLVEELLDSQMIAGCRKIFDYLESRQERLTAKHFRQKSLAILRSCNELLRRLSRAEDTAFCGRVFIFLFQSFPLGDKSSVNLRGEYHVENITAYEPVPLPTNGSADLMEVDSDSKSPQTDPTSVTLNGTSKPSDDPKLNGKSVSFNAKTSYDEEEKPLEPDALYPIFWSLQQCFSQPKKLFDPEQFAELKKGLEATIVMFKSVQNENTGRGPAKSVDDSKRGNKRKRGQGEDELANAFNPKYLTSRDLFELEISDLSFRRHILVQALIVMDFLLSLSSKAKEKVANLTTQNKSVMYTDQILDEEDAKWAIEMKKTIAEYIKEGYEGPFFYRMVETVLSRDKHWVRWKVENCPSIEQPALSSDEYLAAKAAAKKATTNKRLRARPLASLDLSFLTEAEGTGGMEKLKNPIRYRVPSLDSFKDKIALDDLEIDMPASEETKEAAIYGKSSKSWRALRIASKSKMVSFDKIDDPEKINIIFEESPQEPEAIKENEDEGTDIKGFSPPTDLRAVVISGPRGVGKGTLINLLTERFPKLFGRKVSHTTRVPRQGEINGTDYYFVDSEAYSVMRDGDQFLEFNNTHGNDYGTSRKAVEGIIASGKIPIMEMDYSGIQQLKDQNYPARFIFLAAPSMEELERRLRLMSTDSDHTVAELLEIAKDEIKHAQTEGFYDFTIVNDGLNKSLEDLECYVFGKADVDEMVNDGEMEGVDVPMIEASESDPAAEESKA